MESFCACYKMVRKELCLRQHHRDMDKYAFIFLMVTFYIVLLRNSCYEGYSNMKNLMNAIKDMNKKGRGIFDTYHKKEEYLELNEK